MGEPGTGDRLHALLGTDRVRLGSLAGWRGLNILARGHSRESQFWSHSDAKVRRHRCGRFWRVRGVLWVLWLWMVILGKGDVECWMYGVELLAPVYG